MSEIIIDNCSGAVSIQDGGRRGFQRIGLARSGSLDPLALCAANTLVGNAPDTAAFELLLGGLSLRVAGGPVRMAMAGAEFPIRVDDERMADHRSFLLQPGQRLQIGTARAGVCGLLAIEGGLDLPMVLGSRSLHARSEVGGFAGRTLRPGDCVPVVRAAAMRDERIMPALPTSISVPLRVVLGPQDDLFSSRTIAAFLNAEFRVTSECDRMGYRLDGPRIQTRREGNLVSDGVAEGSIQIPGSGHPIVVLADRQTTGGYPKIATIVSQDHRLLAQRRPGETVRFTAVSIATAQPAHRLANAQWQKIASSVRPLAEVAWPFDGSLAADNVVSASDQATWDWRPPDGAHRM